MKIIIGLVLLATCNFLFAQIYQINFENGSEKTQIPTVFWSKSNSKVVLIFIPGGSGSFGITKKINPKPSWLLAELFNSGFTSTILFENNIDVFTMPVTNQSQLLDVISNTNVRNIFIQSDIILNNPAKLTAIGNKIIKNDSSFNVTITAE